jgi:hypothetical protein
MFNVSAGRGYESEHASDIQACVIRLNSQYIAVSLKVYGTLFYMILTALLSVRNKLSAAQKYFKCNTAARLAFNVHVAF